MTVSLFRWKRYISRTFNFPFLSLSGMIADVLGYELSRLNLSRQVVDVFLVFVLCNIFQLRFYIHYYTEYMESYDLEHLINSVKKTFVRHGSQKVLVILKVLEIPRTFEQNYEVMQRFFISILYQCFIWLSSAKKSFNRISTSVYLSFSPILLFKPFKLPRVNYTPLPWKLNITRYSFEVQFGINCITLTQSESSNFVECIIRFRTRWHHCLSVLLNDSGLTDVFWNTQITLELQNKWLIG